MSDSMDGLSLIELLCTLAIITALTTAALPAWQPLVQQQEGKRVMRGLVSLLNNARTAAVQENQPVTVCPAAPDSLQCDSTWSRGAIAFIDPPGHRKASDDTLLHRLQWPANSGELRWRAFGNRQYLVINSRGQIRHQSGNFTWCPADADPRQARQLVLNAVGRIRVARDRDGDGIRENSRGHPLTC
ncbi:MAG: GspH/FimT family pseudopilin [Pseudohongiellaceae bacterium]